jgi:hypothetical protein
VVVVLPEVVDDYSGLQHVSQCRSKHSFRRRLWNESICRLSPASLRLSCFAVAKLLQRLINTHDCYPSDYPRRPTGGANTFFDLFTSGSTVTERLTTFSVNILAFVARRDV